MGANVWRSMMCCEHNRHSALAASAMKINMTDLEHVTRGALPHWYKPGHAHFVTYRLVDTIPIRILRAWRSELESRLSTVPTGCDGELHRERIHKQLFSRYDEYLDSGRGKKWLANDAIAAVIRENLYHHRGTKYELLSYCVMPNHVHVLLQPFQTLLVADAASVGGMGCCAPEQAQQRISCRPAAKRDRSPPGTGVPSPLPPRPAPSASADAGSVVYGECRSGEIEDFRSPLSGIMHSLKSYTANLANQILQRTGRFWQKESYDHWVRDVDELERIVEYIAANPVRAGLCGRAEAWEFSSACDRFHLDRFEVRPDWLAPRRLAEAIVADVASVGSLCDGRGGPEVVAATVDSARTASPFGRCTRLGPPPSTSADAGSVGYDG